MRKSYWPGGLFLGALLSLLTTGCAKGPRVKVYPVTGTVVYRGGAPLTGGSISFQPVDNSAHSVTGTIKDDGTFVLHTLIQNAKLEGAAEGVYRVTIMPPLPPDHKTAVTPITPNQTFQVAPKENQFRIEVDAVRRRS